MSLTLILAQVHLTWKRHNIILSGQSNLLIKVGGRTPMKEDTRRTLAEKPLLRRDIRSPAAWEYLLNYLLLGSSAVLILLQMIESGVWRKLWLPLFLTCLAVFNIGRLRAAERMGAEPDASPNGGPSRRPRNSAGGGGPPSVS